MLSYKSTDADNILSMCEENLHIMYYAELVLCCSSDP